MSSVLRSHQRRLVDHVLARVQGRSSALPDLPLEDLQLAGLATGLTALMAALAMTDRLVLAPDVLGWLDEQAGQVARRVERMRGLSRAVRTALADASVPAVVVKGGALVEHVWRFPDTRPMADVDLVVPACRRAEATAVLEAAGLRWQSSSTTEDTFLAWGDGSVGRTDGESAEHNGKVEVHPGWSEFLHGYCVTGPDLLETAVADPDLPGGRRLPLASLGAHVIGHLSSTVVRAEARAVNVVDVWWLVDAGMDWDEAAEILARTDPRLTAPGLWLAYAFAPSAVPVQLLAREFDRLPRAAQRSLDGAAPEDVLRDPVSRTTVGWRQSFAHGSERCAVLEQMAFPDGRRGLGPLVTRVATRARTA